MVAANRLESQLRSLVISNVFSLIRHRSFCHLPARAVKGSKCAREPSLLMSRNYVLSVLNRLTLQILREEAFYDCSNKPFSANCNRDSDIRM